MSYQRNNYNKCSKKQGYNRQYDNSWCNENVQAFNNRPPQNSFHNEFQPRFPTNAPFPPRFPSSSGYFNNQQSLNPQYNPNFSPNYGLPFQPPPRSFQTFNTGNPSQNRISTSSWTKGENLSVQSNYSNNTTFNPNSRATQSSWIQNSWKKSHSNTLQPNNRVSYSKWTKNNWENGDSDSLEPKKRILDGNWKKGNSITLDQKSTASSSDWTLGHWEKGDSETLEPNNRGSNINLTKSDWKKNKSVTLEPKNTASSSNWTIGHWENGDTETLEPNNRESNCDWKKGKSVTLEPKNTSSNWTIGHWGKGDTETLEPNNTVPKSNLTEDNWEKDNTETLGSNNKVSNSYLTTYDWHKSESETPSYRLLNSIRKTGDSDNLEPNNISSCDWSKESWHKDDLETLEPKNIVSNSDWTKSHWKKGSNDDGELNCDDDDYNKHKGLNTDGFLKPVVADKAERMMQMMGWKGGALGTKGDGITEPIMPHLNHAKGAGLGLKEPLKPSKVDMKVVKKIHEGLLKPVVADKAERMMQMMGWQGGALGTTGDGITEPIMPHLNQSKGAGLGLEKPKKSQQQPKQNTKKKKQQFVSKKKQKKLDANEKTVAQFKKGREVCIDFLYDILDFVCDRKKLVKIFDASLSRGQRLLVHQAIGEIMQDMGFKSNYIVKFDEFESEVMDEIINCNCYVLSTESFGKQSNRQLHVFKEAPKHMYLITKDDLDDIYKDDEVKIIEIADDVVVIDDDDDDIQEKTNEIQEDCVKSNEDKCNGINSKNTEEKSKEEITDNVEESKCIENKSSFNAFMEIIENNKLNVENKCKEDNSKRINEKENNNLIDVTEINSKENNIVTNINIEALTEETKPNTIEQNNKTKEKEYKNKELLRKNLNSYFVEFFNDNAYTELRFLGDFEDWELDIIDEFVRNLNNCIQDPDLAEDIDVDGFKDIFLSDVKLAIDNGFDGGVVISKVFDSNPDEAKTTESPAGDGQLADDSLDGTAV